MSFQAYLDNIKAKTGHAPDDFKRLAEKSGILKPSMTATDFIHWMKDEFDLGRGHAMAIFAVFKEKVWIDKK